MLVVNEGLDCAEKGDVDEEEASPLLTGWEARSKKFAQHGVVEHQPDHAQKDDGAENLEQQLRRIRLLRRRLGFVLLHGFFPPGLGTDE